MTKTQIDRLGDRLRKGPVSEEDLRLLDQYRRSFADAYEVVVATVHAKLGKRPTGRPAKSTISIVDKLQRESVRLSQMQDIAGCRFIVSNVAEQQQAVANLSTSFARASIVDRREHPSHGYRAVHVVALIDTRPIEIQIRTTLQHLWAELSEKLADLIDPGIKYGSGDQQAVSSLADLSSTIAREEKLEIDVASAETALSNQLEQLAEARRRAQGTLSALSGSPLTAQQIAAKEQLQQAERDADGVARRIASARDNVRTQKERVHRLTETIGASLSEMIVRLPTQTGDSSALLD